MIILGLDMSSTCIGYAVHDGEIVTDYSHRDLAGDIGQRCAQAATFVAGLLDRHAPALVVIESPVARFAKAVIPQARVSGAVLAVLANRRALWHELSNSVPKALLAGSGSATKAEMVAAAAKVVGLPLLRVGTCRGKVVGFAEGDDLTEDEADAIGLALAGRAMRVTTLGGALA